MGQFRALTVATLTGLAVVVAEMWLTESLSIVGRVGLDETVVLFWGLYFAVIALILVVANAARRPRNRFDLISSVVGALFAGAWGLVALLRAAAFDMPAAQRGTMGPIGLALTAAVLSFYFFLLVRAATGVARGPSVSMYWSLGVAGLTIGVSFLPDDLTAPSLVVVFWLGMVIGFWMSHLRGTQNPLAWLGFGVSLAAPVALYLLPPQPGRGGFYVFVLLLIAMLPLSLLGSGRGSSH